MLSPSCWPVLSELRRVMETVLAEVGLAPVPASMTRYCTPSGRVTTPGLALLAAMNASDFCLFSRESRSNSAFSCWAILLLKASRVLRS